METIPNSIEPITNAETQNEDSEFEEAMRLFGIKTKKKKEKEDGK